MSSSSQNQNVLRYSYLSGLPLFVMGLFAILLIWFVPVEELFFKLMLPLEDLPRIVGKLILTVIACLLAMMGTWRVTSLIDPAAKEIVQTRHLFWMMPLFTKRIRFGDIRHIDFHHPDSGSLGAGFSLVWFYFFGLWHILYIMATSGSGEIKPYEIRAFMENRDQYLVYRGRGEKRMMEEATRVARVTRKRLG